MGGVPGKLAVAALSALLSLAAQRGQASPVTLTLSDYSSNEVPADRLDATMTFTVLGSTLTVDVTNNTQDPPEEFRINEVYFSATGNIYGLQMDPLEGWACTFSEDAYQVNGFGLFDVGATNGTGDDPNQIQPGQTETFTFQISSYNTATELDFTTELSTKVDDHIESLAAAKFVNGLARSAYGNVIPEPGGLVLLAIGGFTLALRGRRRS